MTRIINKQTQSIKRRVLRRKFTESEDILWQRLRNRQIKGLKFRRQVSFECYVVDFYCSAIKLAIEVDGLIHLKPKNRQDDLDRQLAIESLGVQFVRFNNDEAIKRIDKVIQKIVSMFPLLTKERVRVR